MGSGVDCGLEFGDFGLVGESRVVGGWRVVGSLGGS